MTISSRSTWTSERKNLCICPQLCLPFPFDPLLNESILQCAVLLRHFGQKATYPPDTPVPPTARTATPCKFTSKYHRLQYLHRLLCKHLILTGLTLVNIRQIISSQGDHCHANDGHPLTRPNYRSCARPVIGCTSHKKPSSSMAVETESMRGPLNSVLNSAPRPTVCIKPLSECFDAWPLPGGMSRKISARVSPCKTSPKQLTCKRVVKKYANMKKSPSTDFKRRLFLYADSPRHPSSPPQPHPPPSEPSPSMPTEPADNGPNATLKEKLLNGQNSETGSSPTRENECDANGTDTAESAGSPNGKSLQAACNLVRRKYFKYWRKSLECTMGVGGERRILKNVRLCDVFKPGSDKCSHGRLPQNVVIPSHSPKRVTVESKTTHSENILHSSLSQQRTNRVSRWKTEDKNIFTLMNNTSSIESQCVNRDEIDADENTCIKTDSVAPSSNKHLNWTSADAKGTSSENPILKRADTNQILTSSLSSISSSSSRSHTDSLNCIRKSNSRHCCTDISDHSIDCLQHVDSCKSGFENGPLGILHEKSTHQTCFSEDSAFSSGSSSSSSGSSCGSGIDPNELDTKLPKVQRTRRKNGRQAPYTYNYFTNSEQEGPRIRRRRMCPCCIFSLSPVKKRRSRSCRYNLPGDYQHFVQSTLRLNSLRNKLHLFLTVLFPKLDPFLDSISAESENIDLILDEAVSLVQDGNLLSSTDEPTQEHPSSSTAAENKNKKYEDNGEKNCTGRNHSNQTNNSVGSISSCSMEVDEIIDSGPTLRNVTINVCRSPEQCLSRLSEKTLILLSSLLPGLSFKEEYFHDVTNGHLEYLIDLVVHSNQSILTASDIDL